MRFSALIAVCISLSIAAPAEARKMCSKRLGISAKSTSVSASRAASGNSSGVMRGYGNSYDISTPATAKPSTAKHFAIEVKKPGGQVMAYAPPPPKAPVIAQEKNWLDKLLAMAGAN